MGGDAGWDEGREESWMGLCDGNKKEAAEEKIYGDAVGVQGPTGGNLQGPARPRPIFNSFVLIMTHDTHEGGMDKGLF